MKLSNLWNEKSVTLSFEVFPPKKDSDFDTVRFAAEQIAELKPDFMSVTYGAGGGTSKYTLDIAKNIKDIHGVPTLAHLTCVSSTKETVREKIAEIDPEVARPGELLADVFELNDKILDIENYDSFVDENELSLYAVSKYLNAENVYLTPNMTYKPRVIRKPKNCLVNGSVAILIPKDDVHITDEQLHYFSSKEYRDFYQIARNFQTRSLNVDSCSVYFYGLLKINKSEQKESYSYDNRAVNY